MEFKCGVNNLVNLNIGTNDEPYDDGKLETVGFEPLLEVVIKIKPNPRIKMIVGAVSNYNGFTTFNVYNSNGVSSSLLEWKHGGVLRKILVPVFDIRDIGACFSVNHLKIDAQGLDLHIISNYPREHLRKVRTIQIESSGHDETYKGTSNSREKITSHLESLNFKLIRDFCQGWYDKEKTKCSEWDLWFENKSESNR